MEKKYVFLTVIILSVVHHVCAETFCYPTPAFSAVENLCNEIKNDFDVMTFNDNTHQWLQNPEYVLDKCILIDNAITFLTEAEDSKSYLLEDIDYLMEHIYAIRNIFYTLYKNSHHPLWISINALLTECEYKISKLLLINSEVILS